MTKFTVRSDVVFAQTPSRALKLDVYTPARAPNGAVVVVLHGGGWSRGDKTGPALHAEALAAEGFVAVVPQYRLSGEAPFPAQIQDVRRALRWTRKRANELGFDPDKLCLQGHSAGGHLALLAAGSAGDARLDPPDADTDISTAVAAVATIYPPVLFHREGAPPRGSVPAQALPGADASAEMTNLASPLSHVSARLPPVMLLHGDADKVVPVSTSRVYEERVRAVGGRVDLHVFAGYPHGFANNDRVRPVVMAMIVDFFRRTVVEPDAYAFGPSRFEQAMARG